MIDFLLVAAIVLLVVIFIIVRLWRTNMTVGANVERTVPEGAAWNHYDDTQTVHYIQPRTGENI